MYLSNSFVSARNVAFPALSMEMMSALMTKLPNSVWWSRRLKKFGIKKELSDAKKIVARAMLT